MQDPKQLRIETTENGFMVYDHAGMQGVAGKIWCFNSPQKLAKFIKGWGRHADFVQRAKMAKGEKDNPSFSPQVMPAGHP